MAIKVRNEQGQEFEVDQDKIGQAEQDGFLPVVSNGSQEFRVNFSSLDKAKTDGFSLLGAPKAPPPSTMSDILGGVKRGVTEALAPMALSKEDIKGDHSGTSDIASMATSVGTGLAAGSLAAAGLAALGRRLHCPSVGSSSVHQPCLSSPTVLCRDQLSTSPLS